MQFFQKQIRLMTNKRSLLDTFIFNWLATKNGKLGFLFSLIKILLFIGWLYAFIESSVFFYRAIWGLKNEAFYTAVFCFVPFHLSFVYVISNLFFNIYNRKFVYFDENEAQLHELFKIINKLHLFVLFTYILVLLIIFTEDKQVELVELAFTSLKGIWEAHYGSK